MLQSSSNRHISTSTVQRRLSESGLHGRIAAKKPLLKDTNNKKRLASTKKHFVRCSVGERMISACVFPFVKHGGGCVIVWGCFAVDTVCDLFKIQGTLNQHGYHSILQWYTIPSGLGLVGLSFVFSTSHWPQPPPGYVRAILQRRKVMECCLRWLGLHNHRTSTQLRWFGMSWTTEWRKSSQQVLRICGNSFKTVGKAFQVKLVERMPRVCKAVIKARVATLKNV